MKKSGLFMVLGVLPLAGALSLLAGCNAQQADVEETGVAAPALEADKPAARADHRGMRMGGPDFLLGAALRELDLAAAQKAAIQGEIDALHAARDEARPDFAAHRAALAAAVRSGKIDVAALTPAAPKEHPAPARLAKALETLHATLTAAQRQQLVDAVSAKMDKHGPKGEGRGHERGKGMGRGKMGDPMAHLLRGIELNDAQREKVREALATMAPAKEDRAGMEAHHEAFRAKMRERLASFAADDFDAKAFVAPPEDAAMLGPEHGPAHMVKALALVVPILDDAQRAELAKRIEAPPAR
jgi:hypothetical protein